MTVMLVTSVGTGATLHLPGRTRSLGKLQRDLLPHSSGANWSSIIPHASNKAAWQLSRPQRQPEATGKTHVSKHSYMSLVANDWRKTVAPSLSLSSIGAIANA